MEAVKKLQMVDLISQYNKIRNEIDDAINCVVNSSAYINGPEVKSFATELEEYLDVKNVICCTVFMICYIVSLYIVSFTIESRYTELC